MAKERSSVSGVTLLPLSCTRTLLRPQESFVRSFSIIFLFRLCHLTNIPQTGSEVLLVPLCPSRLLVGAPKEKAVLPNVNETGAVYACPISEDPTDCTRMDLVTSSKHDAQLPDRITCIVLFFSLQSHLLVKMIHLVYISRSIDWLF